MVTQQNALLRLVNSGSGVRYLHQKGSTDHSCLQPIIEQVANLDDIDSIARTSYLQL